MGDPGEALIRSVLDDGSPRGSAADALVVCDWALERGDVRLAASALDRAFGLGPDDERIARHRAAVLDGLALIEHGIRFRYLPAGTFLMGSDAGDADERPVHAARTSEYWLSETPVTWAAYCDLMGWTAPPGGVPPGGGDFDLAQDNKIRRQYCESDTREATDWHAHSPDLVLTDGSGRQMPPAQIFGAVDRGGSSRPYRYDTKPMVAVSWEDAAALGAHLSSEEVEYRLPTEVEWEKAARGGRVAARYAWGDEPPDPARCDFGHFGEFFVRDPRSLAPNDYGLFGMCGGVWEWTADEYDALAYRAGRAAEHPRASGAPPRGEPTTPRSRVLRGGSWADCAEAVTVSFRMSRGARLSSGREYPASASPTIGFRLCRATRRR